MKRTPKLIITNIALMGLLCLAFLGFSQQIKSTNDRPKIGLVLSGGGAKGLAHVGVIKVLEEYGIRPDIITGTSMGSIVGSLYAAGYTLEEMSAINANADWTHLLTDDETLRRVAMVEKTESDKYLFKIPIRDNKINLPAGLIEGQHLESYFAELFWGLTSHEDFNEFPIPFHCMSVDMISGKTIEHQSGDIVKSIRASMSIPTLLSPVQMDSMLLVDGGVTRNFPVQEAIDMGADIIIGVYVGYREDIKAEDLTSMTDILQRSIALAGIVDAKEQNEKCDILIIPDLGEYGSGDFTKGEIIEQLGEDAARKQSDEIAALAKQLNCSLREVPKIRQPRKVLISHIEVENLQYLSRNYVTAKSGIEKGDSVSFHDIHNAIEYMYGSRHFRKLTYSLKENEKGEGYVLVFHVKENPRAKFKITPNYDDDLGVGLVTNFTLRNIILPSSRLLLTANIAENPGLSIVLDKKLGKSQRFSDHYYLNLYSYKLPFYDEGERLGRYKRGYFEGAYGIQYAPGLNHRIGAKFGYKHDRLTPNSDFQNIYPEANFKRFSTDEWAYSAFYEVNTTNDLYFPTKGIKLEVSFTHTIHINSELDRLAIVEPREYFVDEIDEPYAALVIEHNWYKTFAKVITYNFGVGSGFNSNDPGANGLFMLGGSQYGNKLNFKNFAGYNFAELYTNNFAYAKSAVNIEVATGLFLSGTVNVASLGETYEDVFDNITDFRIGDYIWGYNVGLKYDSLLGPIQLLVSDNNKDGETRFHLSIGFPF